MAFVTVCAGLAYVFFVQGAKVVAELMDRTFFFLVDSIRPRIFLLLLLLDLYLFL